jgi:NAD(P)-dependent dehydrogenase (short-subunit alcohol dehydrogenase family)
MPQPPDAELRFDGRVAIVTGAGGQKPNLGETYARMLASRGARVVVNDLGIGPDGHGGLPANAQAIVDEINAAGGEAIGDTHSVAEPESAKAVVQTAIDAWGRVDILVNNAGVLRAALFDEVTDRDIALMFDTHLLGSTWMSRAVWPHMREASYGRIVNICSGAFLGTPRAAVYSAAKAGTIGLTNGLALEGGLYGIKVNVVSPVAPTRKHAFMTGSAANAALTGGGTTEQVAAVVGYLCHEICDVTGVHLAAGLGSVAEYFILRTPGFTDADLVIETVRTQLETIRDRESAVEHVLPDSAEAFAHNPFVPYRP